MGHWTALWVDHHEAVALRLEVEGLGHARIAHVHGHDEHVCYESADVVGGRVDLHSGSLSG